MDVTTTMTKHCSRRAGRSAMLLLVAATLVGCGRFKEVRMVDPRTGVGATCRSERYNLLTTSTAVNEVNACIQELTYYGFQDEEALLAATKPR